MTTTRLTTLLPTILAMVAAAVALAAPAGARMVSKKVAPHVCLTTGGGRFVAIPGFPGERIDRRLLNDIKYLRRRYKVFITDGYSNDPVHAGNGEHPIGLALDIVPDAAAGGTWSDVTALANWAEPSQDHPVAPFRWVGYDGDAGHGRGDHLHLSWDHSDTVPGRPAKSVYTMRCPGAAAPRRGGKPGGGDGGSGGDGGGQASGGKGHGGGGKGGGGTTSGGIDAGNGGGGSTGGSGGLGAGRIFSGHTLDPNPPVVETGGVGLGG